MRRYFVPLMFGTVVLVSAKAYAAPCTQEQKDSVTAPIEEGAEAKRYRVKLDCDLTLDPADRVEKRIVFEGPAASGLTLDCNGATLDGSPGTKNDGQDMIVIASAEDESVTPHRFTRPSDITIRNCNIKGSMRIYGMGTNGEGEWVRESSRRDAGHISRVRAATPTRITLDNLTITSYERTGLYLAPGVTYVSLTNSEIKGNAIRTALYLDAESAYNTIKDNYFHVDVFDRWDVPVVPTTRDPPRLGPQISVDASSHNKIISNRFGNLDGGGIYTYRNCGEGGTVRHGSSSYNQIIDNVFHYAPTGGAGPAVKLGTRGNWLYDNPLGIGYCDEDDGFTWGSSASNYPHSRYNIVMGNRTYRLEPEQAFVVGDASNTNNIIDYNEKVSSSPDRPAGCYISNGYKNFLRGGESTDVVKGANDIPMCIVYRATCNDGVIGWTSTSGCNVLQVPFECSVSGNNGGCSTVPMCTGTNRIVGVRAACNLEGGGVTDSQLQSVSGSVIDVVRASDNVPDGSCFVASTTIRSGEAIIEGAFDRRSLQAGCREHDSNGGDCQIRGVLYCRQSVVRRPPVDPPRPAPSRPHRPLRAPL